MPDAPQIADAVLIPDSMKSGERSAQRVASVADVVDPLLGVNPSAGEVAWIRHTRMTATDGTGYNFVSKSMQDSLNYPKSHPLKGKPRYRWEPLDGGPIRLGYLIDPGERKDATLIGA